MVSATADEPPPAETGVVHITRGYSRDGKPAPHRNAGLRRQDNDASLLRPVDIGVRVKDRAGYSKAFKAHEQAKLK